MRNVSFIENYRVEPFFSFPLAAWRRQHFTTVRWLRWRLEGGERIRVGSSGFRFISFTSPPKKDTKQNLICRINCFRVISRCELRKITVKGGVKEGGWSQKIFFLHTRSTFSSANKATIWSPFAGGVRVFSAMLDANPQLQTRRRQGVYASALRNYAVKKIYVNTLWYLRILSYWFWLDREKLSGPTRGGEGKAFYLPAVLGLHAQQHVIR